MFLSNVVADIKYRAMYWWEVRWQILEENYSISTREWPKNAPSILRNHNNFPTGAFYLIPSPLQLGTKEYCILSDWVSVGIENTLEWYAEYFADKLLAFSLKKMKKFRVLV